MSKRKVPHEITYLLANRNNVNARHKATAAIAFATSNNEINKRLLKRLKENHNRVQEMYTQLSEYLEVLEKVNKNQTLEKKYENISNLLGRYNNYTINESKFMTQAKKYNLDLDTLYKRDLNGIIERFRDYSRKYDIQNSMNFNNPNYHNRNNRQYGSDIHLAGQAAKNVLPIAEKLKKNYNRNRYMKLKEYYENFHSNLFSRRYPRAFNGMNNK